MQFSNIANPEINIEKPKTTSLVVATWTNLIFVLLIIASFSVLFVVGLFWILLNKIIKVSWILTVLPYRNVKLLAEKVKTSYWIQTSFRKVPMKYSSNITLRKMTYLQKSLTFWMEMTVVNIENHKFCKSISSRNY